MKKLLLVLLVLALASFLFVGCLPTTPAEGEGEGEGEVTMTIEKEYTDAGGVTFVACGKDVIVTLPIAVEVDYVVYVAIKVWNETDEVYEYYCMEAGTPDATRTVWTIEDYTKFCCGKGYCIDECEPYCLVALVKHPCCPGDEVALRVVTLDCTPPELDLFVKFTDCYDPCAEEDPCDPYVPGMYMEWTSRTTDICETTDCCKDYCSGDGPWSLVIDSDPCLGPCDTAPGEGCPVEGAIECGCLLYAETGEAVYYVDFSFEDNVGNTVTSTWELTFDTDELTGFEVGSRDDDGDYVPGSPACGPDVDGWYQIYDDCTPFPG